MGKKWKKSPVRAIIWNVWLPAHTVIPPRRCVINMPIWHIYVGIVWSDVNTGQSCLTSSGRLLVRKPPYRPSGLWTLILQQVMFPPRSHCVSLGVCQSPIIFDLVRAQVLRQRGRGFDPGRFRYLYLFDMSGHYLRSDIRWRFTAGWWYLIKTH